MKRPSYTWGSAFGAALLLAAVAPPRAAAATITIDPTTVSGVLVTSENGIGPAVVPAGGTAPDGAMAIGFFNANVAVDFPFTVTTAGVYTATVPYGTPNVQPPDNGLPVAITLDFKKQDSQQHYETQDIVLAKTGDDDSAYGLTGSTVTAAGIPLTPGDYILEVRNVSLLHTTAATRAAGYQYRQETNFAQSNRNANFGAITLTSSAATPATGTVSGKVSATDLGYGVGGAYVMAVPAGSEVAEPGPFWQSGYWTITNPDGTYSLSVPANTPLTVEAGRPDTYKVEGGRTTGVTVTSGGTATANVSLTSRWSQVNGSGTLQVEEEYFFDKIPDAVPDAANPNGQFYVTGLNIQGASEGQNGIKITYTDAGDYIDFYVDVPTGQGGAYDLSKTYTTGQPAGGTAQFIANPGAADENSIQQDLPNSGGSGDPSVGYYTPTTKLFDTPLTLHEGRNVVREFSVTSGVDYDAIILQKHVAIATGPGVANPKDALDPPVARGEKGPGTTTTPSKIGNTIQEFYRGSYVEMPMTFDQPGIYKAVINSATNVNSGSLQLDIRPADTENHYATDDTPVPNTGSMSVYAPVTINNIPVLQSGNYILRVRNTTLVHTTTADRSPIYSNTVADSSFVYNGVNFGQTVFTKTAALPATGTVSGTVRANNIGNFGVQGAYVMANAPTALVGEPSTFWQKGFWTTSAASGAYSLPVLAGAYAVQAGRPDMYNFAGGSASATVATGGTATADINLPARYTQDAAGHYSVLVESEYFFDKAPDAYDGGAYQPSVIVLQGHAKASNGIRCGYTDPGDYVDINVDVPSGAGGLYTMEDHYFNGYYDGVSRPDGVVDFIANPGGADENTIEDSEPNTAPAGQNPNVGYETPGIKVFATSITLHAGHNVIRQKLVSGSSTFDAFKITSNAVFPLQPSALRALRIAGGLDKAPAAGAAFTALDVVTDGKIDLRDAVRLAQQGKF